MQNSYGPKALRTSVRLTLAAIAVSSIPFSVTADEQLDAMTVTANRMPSLNVLAPTTVITRADIERLQINDLPSLLSRQPGIDMTVSGGIGKVSSIHIRGTNSDHVLFLVDGVKWHSATLGGTSIQDFPVEQVERIEIVRGSRSGLYGSEAIGGVIQIFTRQGQQGFTPYAKASYGSHDSKQFSAGVSGGDELTEYNLSINHQSTEGINARTDKNLDKDGYRSNSVSANVKHKVTDNVELTASILRAESHNDADAGKWGSAAEINTSNNTQQVLQAGITADVTEDWALNLQLGESRDENDNSDIGGFTPTSNFNTRHRFVTLINTVNIFQEHYLNIGLDYIVDDIDGSADYAETSRDNKAIFISWQANVDQFSYLLSVRHDDNEHFGSKNTGTAEWGYQFKPTLQFVMSAGTSFKAPTFNDLYWPFVGNKDLQPEESTSWTMGLNGKNDLFDWGVNIYHTKIDDLIDWAPTSYDPNIWVPTNINQAKVKGLEFDISTVLIGADISANASFLKPEDEATGNLLARRSQRLANIHIDKQKGAWSTGASLKLRGHSFDNASNTIRLGGYGLLDLRVSYKIDSDWSVQANIKNVFDKEYQTVKDYNSLDRTGMVTLSYTP
ncbi:MAG: TonB-dependent receptor [Methylophaga sp.]|nr:TonB-dependent receptor [Methylophaga sp.]